MKKFLKAVAVIIITIFVLILGVLYHVQHGIDRDFYICDGRYEFKNKEDGTNGNGKLYFALTQFPFFNVFWSDAYGTIDIENHWEGNEGFYALQETMNLGLYQKKEDDNAHVYYSFISDKIELVNAKYIFKGSCSKRK